MYPSFSDSDQKLVINVLHEILSIVDSTGNRSHNVRDPVYDKSEIIREIKWKKKNIR